MEPLSSKSALRVGPIGFTQRRKDAKRLVPFGGVSRHSSSLGRKCAARSIWFDPLASLRLCANQTASETAPSPPGQNGEER